jgi:hypothetical protein
LTEPETLKRTATPWTGWPPVALTVAVTVWLVPTGFTSSAGVSTTVAGIGTGVGVGVAVGVLVAIGVGVLVFVGVAVGVSVGTGVLVVIAVDVGVGSGTTSWITETVLLPPLAA